MGKKLKLFLKFYIVLFGLFFSSTIFLMEKKSKIKLSKIKLMEKELEAAIKNQDFESFRNILFKGEKINSKIMNLAKKSMNKDIKDFTIGFSSFLQACQKGDSKKVENILKKYPEEYYFFWPLLQGPENKSPWDYVIYGNQDQILNNFIAKNLPIIQGVKSKKETFVINRINYMYHLLCACCSFNVLFLMDIFRMNPNLLKKTVNIVDKYRDTGLHKLLYAFEEKRQVDSKKEKEEEKKKGITDFIYDSTIIDLKKKYPEVYKVVEILIKSGADIYRANIYGQSPDFLAKKIDEGYPSFSKRTNIQEILHQLTRSKQAKEMLANMAKRKKPLEIKEIYIGNCPICQNKPELKNTLVLFPCGHTIHRHNPDIKKEKRPISCFQKAYEMSDLCPICRKKIEKVEKLERLQKTKLLKKSPKGKKDLDVELKKLETQRDLFKKHVLGLKNKKGKEQQVKFLEDQISKLEKRMLNVIELLEKIGDKELSESKKIKESKRSFWESEKYKNK